MHNDHNSEKIEYEARLQNRLQILFKMIEEGKMHFFEGLEVVNSLKTVRKHPNGSFDLKTVDSLVRSTALAAEHFHYRQESKRAISLREIQNSYFTFIWNQFENLFVSMNEHRATPHIVAKNIASNPNAVSEIVPKIDTLLAQIKDFWSSVQDANQFHIEDLSSHSKGIFGGDLFPSNQESIASKSGIFIDTIILPDPFLRSIPIYEFAPPDKRAYYTVKHALNILQYMDLACADLPIPIVAIFPDRASLNPDERDFIFELGKQDATNLGGIIYGRQFADFDEFMDFSNKLNSVEKVVQNIKAPDRVLFDTEWKESIPEQINRALTEDTNIMLGIENPGILIANQALGRMSVSNEILLKSRQLRGIPIIDAPTSWKYLTFKLSLDAKAAEEVLNVHNLHITRALENLSGNDFSWLGKIPHPALLELRTSGAISEIREIIGNGISDLALSNPSDFSATTDKVFYNINDALRKYEDSVKELRNKKWKFAGSNISAWVALGTIEVTAAATGFPVWGLAAFLADQLLPIPKLKDIPKSMQSFITETRELKKSPIGMLFSLSKTS